MNLDEAYKILELQRTATPEEAKKQYKRLASKLHPDVNKASDAEATFKKVNEAYQVVSSGKSTDREELHWQSPFRQTFDPFGQHRFYDASPIIIKTVLTFAESVLGCEKDIKFHRHAKCSNCDGVGEIAVNNGCTQCNGKGQITTRKGNMIFSQTCPKCQGQTQKTDCSTCHANGIIETEASVRVNVPGGVITGNVLNLRGMGHFIGSFGPMEQHADAHLHLQVIPEPGLSLQGADVIFSLELSLQEALQGCQKIVKTINGYQDIDVPPKARNKEEIVMPHLGVDKIGNQRVILDVKYPDDVSQIIQVLQTSSQVN